jgi:hypothetical protein
MVESKSDEFVKSIYAYLSEKDIKLIAKITGHPIGEKLLIEIPEEWQNINNDDDFPEEGSAYIYAQNDKPIGEIKWDVEFGKDWKEGVIYAIPVNVRLFLNTEYI